MTKREMELTVQGQDGEPSEVYLYLPNHPRERGCVARTVQAGFGVLLDLDANDQLIGVEILLPLVST